MSIAQEFKKFILRGNVVDLAVGVVIGAAFSKIVTSLVEDIFMPVVGFVAQGYDFAGTVIRYNSATIRVGSFAQTVVNFLIIGACMFLVVKGMNMLKRKEEAAPTAPPTPTELLLAEIRDVLKAKG